MILSAIILAAGESRRMGTPKALLEYRGSTFLEIIIQRLREAGLDEVIVVLGARAGQVAGSVSPDELKVVVNRYYTDGQLSSLHRGLKAVNPGAAGVLVTLVDHPLVLSSTYSCVREIWENNPGKIIMAQHQGRGGHPVIFPRAVFGELLEAPLNVGACAVVRNDPDRVKRVEIDDPGIVADIDTPGDYERFIKEV